MPKTLDRPTVTLTTNRGREVQMPVDGLGRQRYRAVLDKRTVVRDSSSATPSASFSGHAAMFNKRTWIGSKQWGFWEQISPGAFTKTLQEADVRFLVNHDPNLLMGRNVAGTLRLAEDDLGLAVDADMDLR